MKIQTMPITIPDLAETVRQLRRLELSCEWERSKIILESIFADISGDIDFSRLPLRFEAEFARLIGYCLSQEGKCRGIPEHQIKGKNLLSHAIQIFSKLGLHDEAAEANVILALCYWYSGGIEESEIILSVTEKQYQGNYLHPVFLRIRLNRMLTMIWKKDGESAIAEVEFLHRSMEQCADVGLQIMFHNQAGLAYEMTGRYELAAEHMQLAIHYARGIGSERFIAVNLNNLAVICKSIGRFADAHRLAEESLSIFVRLNDTGWQPNVLDTIALIYLDEDRPHDALRVINEALDLFGAGEDFSAMADSLLTKCRCLLALNRKEEALGVFAKLYTISDSRIGSLGLRKFEAEFGKLILINGVPAPAKEVVRLPRLVGSVMELKSSKLLHHAARDLDIPFKFLALYYTEQPYSVIFATVTSPSLCPGRQIIYVHDSAVAVGSIGFDSATRVLFIEGEQPIPISDIRIIGSVVGYAHANDVVRGSISFRSEKEFKFEHIS